MKLFAFIVFLFTALPASAQWTFDPSKISDDAYEILLKIENDKWVPSENRGMFIAALPNDHPLNLLKQKLTVDELVELTNHDKPIVRCYAFKALTMVSEPAAFSVISNHLQDTAVVSTNHGCFSYEPYVGDFFIDVYRDSDAITHDSVHLAKLDSILLFTSNVLESREGAIADIKPDLRYYRKIRDLVVSEPTGGALIALAKFKNESDIDLIINTNVKQEQPYQRFPHLANLQAIYEFRHERFFPYLETHVERVTKAAPDLDSRFLYMVISAYESKRAHDLLSRLFQIQNPEIRAQHLVILSDILSKNKSAVFNDLRRKLKGTHL